jgi:hypothetical protein
MLGVFMFHESWEAPIDEYDGKQFVGIDLHRQRSVIVRQTEAGEQLSAVRIVNDPVALGLQLEGRRRRPRGSARSNLRMGTGQSTCCKPRKRKCIWRTRWESRGFGTGE